MRALRPAAPRGDAGCRASRWVATLRSRVRVRQVAEALAETHRSPRRDLLQLRHLRTEQQHHGRAHVEAADLRAAGAEALGGRRQRRGGDHARPARRHVAMPARAHAAARRARKRSPAGGSGKAVTTRGRRAATSPCHTVAMLPTFSAPTKITANGPAALSNSSTTRSLRANRFSILRAARALTLNSRPGTNHAAFKVPSAGMWMR